MKKHIVTIAFIILLIFLVQSCKKNAENDALFELIGQNGYTYYVGTPGITAGGGNSPHGFERVRFNAIAQAALDSAGKLPTCPVRKYSDRFSVAAHPYDPTSHRHKSHAPSAPGLH